MASREFICENCISVCKAPQNFSEESLLQLVNRGLRGRILGTHTVPGAESDTNLARWIVWFESAEDVSKFLTEFKGNRIKFEGQSYTVTYEKTIPCEIPESWTEDYAGDRGQQQTYPRHMSQKTEEPEHRTPPRPPGISSQQAAYNRLSHEGQHNVNHPQHQYMVSGYYQNISPDAQIKVEQKNEGIESNKQPGLHGNLPHNHQFHDQGFQHNVGEDYSQGQGRYTTPVSGQVPFQGQVLGRGHMSPEGLYPQLNEMSGLPQPPQQGVVHGQGFVQPMGGMPDQGLSHQLARMPGQRQYPQHNIMFGPGQVPPEGQMYGENQFVQQRMMPFQVHVPQHPDMHGQSQAPNQGGIPSQGLSPQQKDDTQDEGKADQGKAPREDGILAQGLSPQQNIIPGQSHAQAQGVHGQGQSLQESEMPGQVQDRQQDQTSDQGKVSHHGRIPSQEQAQSQHLQINFNAPGDFRPGNYQNMAPFGMFQTGIPPHFGPGHAYNSGGQNVPFPVGMMPQYMMGPRGQLVQVPGYSNLPTQQASTLGTQEYEPQRESTPHKTGRNVEELDDGKDVPHSDTYNYDEEYNQDRAELIQEPLEKPTKIVVSNLPSSAHDEYLEMFFENTKKYGGGPVKEVVVDEEANSAIIEFEECDAVDLVLSKRPVRMLNQNVDIEVYIPEPPVPLCTIQVKGPPSIIEQTETIEMYFESERKSLGGSVTGVRYDSQEELAYVTFETEEIAERVVEKPDHHINRQRLSVQLFKPSRNIKTAKRKENVYEEEVEDAEEIQEPACNVKVKGVKALPSRDTFEFYFENHRRSGGGEIESIVTDDEDDDIIHIKFKSEEVAKAVADKRCHKLEGHELHVSLYVPPKPLPSYDNKVLIKGLNPQTTQDCLFNFIEAKTDFVPESMVYHSQQEGVVMVTMEQTSDFSYEKLEKIFASAKLEGNTLKLAKVSLSNCIMVSNLAETVTKDTVEFYFENKRKSGGGTVSKVVMNDDSTCFVYFEDYKTIESVLNKHHYLGGERLLVQRYQDCLGRPEGDTSERKLKVPDCIVLNNIDSQKLKFMNNSKVNRDGIEKQLNASHTNIIWPKESGDVVLECTLTKDVNDCFKVVKTWSKDAQKTFDDFMKKIIVYKIDVLQDLWEKVIDQLKNINVSKPEAAAVFVEKKEGMITVVGNKPEADALAKQLHEIKKQAMDELEKERRTIKEVFTAFKPIEMKMLVSAKYPRKMEEEFGELKVKIKLNRNEIVFEGSSTSVQNAKLKMYEMKNSFECKSVKEISKQKHALYQSNQTKEFIVKELKDTKVTAVWEVRQSGLVICSTKEHFDESSSVICESIKDKSIHLIEASQSVMNSKQWDSKLDELQGLYQGKCEIDVSEADIHICATNDILDEIVDNVNEFLRLNTVLVEIVPCSRNAHRLIERHHKDALSKISNELQSSQVRVTSLADYGGFEVRGTEDGVNFAKKRLIELLNKIKKREHTMDKPGLSDHMETPKGKDSLNTIETMLHCVLSVKGDGSEAQSDTSMYHKVPADSGVSKNFGVEGVKVLASCTFYDTRFVHIVQGDMTELFVDVLVHPADDKLSLSGGLGKAIVSKGGREIEKECQAFIQSKSRLVNGRAFFSTAGNLNAMYIAHVRGPLWKQGQDNEEDKLTEAVSKCLLKSSSKRVLSIAIPAISCGNYGYPIEHATSTIVKAVKNFFRKEQDSSVTDIYLCDVNTNTVEKFTEAAARYFGERSLQKYTTRHESKPRFRSRSQAQSSDEDSESMDTDDENDRRGGDSWKPSPGAAKVYRGSPPLPRPRTTQQQHSSEVKIGDIRVSVVKGQIARQKVDVIVNTTAKNLDLKNGAVSASLLKAGGHNLQQEIGTKYPNGINDGEIAITSGQKLNCNMVIHSTMANWDGNNADSCKAALHKLITDCLDEAETQKFASIAFPAIGTGNLAFPRDVVATEMFNAVGKFTAKSLQEVRFIVYQQDLLTIQAFENELGRCKKSGSNARQSRKYNMYEDMHKGRTSSVNSGDSDGGEDTYEVIDGPDRMNQDYKIGDISVTVKQGDITKEDSECIVNSSNEALDLRRGAVSKALLSAGGTSLQTELNKLRKKMKEEHFVISSAPGLPCKKIIHIVAKETSDEWKQIVKQCLEVAEKKSLKSIAFPALGTGLRMEATDIAETLVKAVSEFEASKPKHLTNIRFVIYQADMVEEFHKAIRDSSNKGKGWIGGLIKAAKDFWRGQTDQHDPIYAKPKKKKNHNIVTFLVFAMSEDIIDQAIKKLESFLEKEIHSKKFKESAIKKMDDNQLMEIKAIAGQHQVKLSLDAKNGLIEISGIANNVMTATDKIHRIIRDAVTLEQQQNSADLLINIVQWFYIEIGETGQKLQPYEKNLNYKIENAYNSGAPNVKFTTEEKERFRLDFGKMEEYPENDPKDTVSVIRRDLIKQSSFGSFEPPATWGDMTGNLRVVALQAGSAEYQDIAQKFTSSSGGSFNISKIERIQNKTLWHQYQAKKKQLEDQNPQGTQNENLLWHGTAPEAVDNINAHGFNRSYCGKNATAYGDGVYFAVNANYSCSNTYSRPDASGVKRIYYCRVLTGEYTRGQNGMRVPPQKAGAASTSLYDSVVDNPGIPNMFIIFHDTQAYPEYILSC